MVYKIGNVSDLEELPQLEDTALELLYHYASVLTHEYGENRNIDTEDGGFVLYATSGTCAEDIKPFFDFSKAVAESVDRYGELVVAMFLLNNEYAVTIVMSASDAPQEFINMLEG